jgi:hypothetical protein
MSTKAERRARKRENRQAKEEKCKAELLEQLPDTFLWCRSVDAEADADAEKAIRAGKPIPHDNGALWSYFCSLARSGLCVSVVARTVGCTEEELAMIWPAINPALAAMTPASVHNRHKRAK